MGHSEPADRSTLTNQPHIRDLQNRCASIGPTMASPAIKTSSSARSATTLLPTPYLAILNAALDSIGAVKSVRRGHEIYGENEPAEFLYKVLSGTVRTSKVLSDGRRQIGAFYCSGEMFGLEFGETYSFFAGAAREVK